MTRRQTLPALALLAGVAAPASAAADATIAEGTLHDALGAPLSAKVTAYAFPLNGSSAMPKLAEVQTDATGHYRITAPASAKRYASERRLDVVLTARTAAGDAFEIASRVLPAEAQAAVAEPPQTIDLLAEPPQRGAGARAASRCTLGKIVKKRLTTWKAATVVGEINNAYDDTTADFVYARERHAESTISTAITAPIVGDVANLRWRTGSSVKVNNRGARVGPTGRRGPLATRVLTNFQYARYRVSDCGLDGEHHWFVVRPEFWRGGYSLKRQRGTLNVCRGGDDYDGRGLFETESENATTFERGIDISSKIGIDFGLSTKSGFSDNVRLTMHFNGKRRHRLCGNDGKPAVDAQRVFSGEAR